MRTIAMCLLALALAKLGLMQHLQMAGARDVIVAAYGSKALSACEAVEQSLKLSGLGLSDLVVKVGDRSRSVALWQVDHADWAARFRSVQLVVQSKDGPVCTFDPSTGLATRPGKTTVAGS